MEAAKHNALTSKEPVKDTLGDVTKFKDKGITSNNFEEALSKGGIRDYCTKGTSVYDKQICRNLADAYIESQRTQIQPTREARENQTDRFQQLCLASQEELAKKEVDAKVKDSAERIKSQERTNKTDIRTQGINKAIKTFHDRNAEVIEKKEKTHEKFPDGSEKKTENTLRSIMPSASSDYGSDSDNDSGATHTSHTPLEQKANILDFFINIFYKINLIMNFEKLSLYLYTATNKLNNYSIYCIYLLSSTPIYCLYLVILAFALFGNIHKNFLHFFCLIFLVLLLIFSLVLPVNQKFFTDSNHKEFLFALSNFSIFKKISNKNFMPFYIFTLTILLLITVNSLSLIADQYFYEESLKKMADGVVIMQEDGDFSDAQFVKNSMKDQLLYFKPRGLVSKVVDSRFVTQFTDWFNITK